MRFFILNVWEWRFRASNLKVVISEVSSCCTCLIFTVTSMCFVLCQQFWRYDQECFKLRAWEQRVCSFSPGLVLIQLAMYINKDNYFFSRFTETFAIQLHSRKQKGFRLRHFFSMLTLTTRKCSENVHGSG